MSKMNTLGNKNMQGKTPAFLKDNGSKKQGRGVLGLVLLAVFGVFFDGTAWGQTDYSGVYYIGSAGYNASTPANNYYLCPTEGWLYYMPTNNWSTDGTTYPNPFLTTFKCKTNAYHGGNSIDAVWIIEKAPNSEYYYIKQASTGRYMVSNGQISGTNNANRMRVHIESVAPENLDDKALFSITPYLSWLVISPKSSAGWNGTYKWYTVNSGNKDALGGSGSNGGPGDYAATGGILGTYTQDDANAKFYLEPATIAAPTITNNFDGTITITAASGATIYYTTDGTTPTMSSSVYSTPITLTDAITVIKAIAKGASDYFPSLVSTYEIPVCERPVITVSSSMATITCATAGASFFYTTNGSQATTSSTPYNGPFSASGVEVIRAIATSPGYLMSNEAFYYPFVEVSSSSEITNMNGRYILLEGFTSSASIGTSEAPFRGQIDGGYHAFALNGHALVGVAEDAVIKNVVVSSVTYSGSGNVGAICNEAKGDTRIYNCGILPSDPNFTNTSTVGSSDGYCGGLVGLLDGSSRVINCYSFADITGGTTVAGIVGYNGYSSTSADLRTMVMNCMFYGNIAGATQISPIYGGQKISNVGATGLNNYNYFRYESAYSRNGNITEYNCALGAEERYLVRFEFHRTLLNSNRALAAFYATGSADESEMLKWVLDKTVAPYPILKVQGTYPTVVNYDAVNVVDIDANNVHRNEGRRLTDLGNNGVLTVNIQAGNGAVFNAPNGASLGTTSLSINIIDKDYDDFNFNYGKIQLPYYNEVGSGNYTGNRVVTGWKIVGVTGGEKGTYVEADEFGGYNYADREHWAKDYYNTADGGSGRIFNQGAYWEVPYGVTAITIEPYWAQCVYLSDPYYDVTYTPAAQATNFTAHDLTVAGVRYNNDTEYSINGSNQKVYTTVANARTALASNKAHTPFDYAIVLVGNYHFCQGNSTNSITGHNYNNSGDVAKQPYTFMSADLDFDNEPDNVMLYQHGHLRTGISPVRFDFFPVVGIGMAHKEDGIQFMPEAGTFWNSGWFEITNTSLIKLSQIEYATNKQMNAPIILQGGIYDYFYSYQGAEGTGDTPRTTFIHVGGNAYFDDFSNGSHLNNTDFTPHVPISVTGGDFNMFYLSGYTLPKNDTPASGTDDAECYIDGGRFEEMAGAGMWAIDGDVTWSINNADITSFFGGGINGARPITGSISTTIANSHVSLFCGGPKFGDMTENKTVVTTATDCVFGKYFGAGYGGTAFNRITATENNNVNNTQFTGWDGWLDTYYRRQYSASNGISTNYELLFFQYSGGGSFKNVAQIYVNYASLSLSTTRGVTSTLNNCTVNFDFYGGGNLGNVQGNVISTLTDCVVHGSVFGGGFSATAPTVEVYPLRTDAPPMPPYLNGDAGVFVPAEYPSGVTYTWKHANSIGTGFDDTDGHFILTTENLDNLGKVVGNTEVRVLGRTKVFGNIYGGGNMGEVGGNTKVIINGQQQP